MNNRRALIVSRVAMLAIFLALIRCISEPLRLQYYSLSAVSVDEIRPFLYGALICAGSLFSMTILSFYARYKWITATAIITIVLMLIVKWHYSI